jgi:hypothetical protein
LKTETFCHKQATLWYKNCTTECPPSNCDETNALKLCAIELQTSQQVKDDCLNGAFETKTTCDCWTDLETFIKSKTATCGADYGDNELTTIDVVKGGVCTPQALMECTPFQQKQLQNYSSEMSQCSEANSMGKITQVGKLCTCLDDVNQNAKKINRTCGFLDSVKQVYDFQFQLYGCSMNKGTNLVCDESKVEACSKGLSSCQVGIFGAATQVCNCYSGFGRCVSTANVKNCPSAQLAQTYFYPACKSICPVATDCGEMSKLNFSDFPTPAPEPTPAPTPHYVTDSHGKTVTGRDGKPVTETEPADTEPPTPRPTRDPYEDCTPFQSVKAALCAKDCFAMIGDLIGNDGSVESGKYCDCSQKIHECIVDAGCKLKTASTEQKADCLKQCPGKAFCSGTVEMVVPVVAVLVAVTIALF